MKKKNQILNSLLRLKININGKRRLKVKRKIMYISQGFKLRVEGIMSMVVVRLVLEESVSQDSQDFLPVPLYSQVVQRGSEARV